MVFGLGVWVCGSGLGDRALNLGCSLRGDLKPQKLTAKPPQPQPTFQKILHESQPNRPKKTMQNELQKHASFVFLKPWKSSAGGTSNW